MMVQTNLYNNHELAKFTKFWRKMFVVFLQLKQYDLSVVSINVVPSLINSCAIKDLYI